MKIAIISDSHDNIKNLQKAINWLNSQNIAIALHCGDICSQDTMRQAEKDFKGRLMFVKGNGDWELDLPEKNELEIQGKKIFFNHYPEIARKAAESGNYDFAFYGHTHRPWEEKVGNCRLVNPGEIAGQRYKPSFALCDIGTGKLELKILETLEYWK